jgi:hypothetical protein
MGDLAVSLGALDANRAGRLSPDQLRGLQASVRYRSRGLVGHLLHGRDAFAQDVASGRVSAAEGAITKKLWQPISFSGDSNVPPSFQIFVASREAGNQQFKSDRELYGSAPDGGLVRLFYLPQSRWTVNFELLPDKPPPDGRLDSRVKQALLGWRAARKAHDPVGDAQARAEMAAIQREVASYLPEHGPPADGQVEPGRLREAITGDWASPFLSVSIHGDGTLTATMAAGQPQAGRWTMDPAGRVHTDVMGAAMVIDASVAGDVLTLVINGQALNLRRSPA